MWDISVCLSVYLSLYIALSVCLYIWLTDSLTNKENRSNDIVINKLTHISILIYVDVNKIHICGKSQNRTFTDIDLLMLGERTIFDKQSMEYVEVRDVTETYVRFGVPNEWRFRI